MTNNYPPARIFQRAAIDFPAPQPLWPLSLSLALLLFLLIFLLYHPGDSENIPRHPTPAVKCENNALVDRQLANKN